MEIPVYLITVDVTADAEMIEMTDADADAETTAVAATADAEMTEMMDADANSLPARPCRRPRQDLQGLHMMTADAIKSF